MVDFQLRAAGDPSRTPPFPFENLAVRSGGAVKPGEQYRMGLFEAFAARQYTGLLELFAKSGPLLPGLFSRPGIAPEPGDECLWCATYRTGEWQYLCFDSAPSWRGHRQSAKICTRATGHNGPHVACSDKRHNLEHWN